MKIAVVAANGRSGQAFVEAALEAGHAVRAGVHSKSHFKSHPNLTIVQCDATDQTQLTTLLSGQAAVASFIGHTRRSDPNVQTTAIEQLVTVMQALGMTRLVSLTGTGVRSPGDKIGLVDRFLNLSIRIIDPARVKDGQHHVEILQQTDLEWTVIRVLKLQNISPKPFALRLHGPTKWFVGRREVALAVLEVLDQRSFIKQAPIICKR